MGVCVIIGLCAGAALAKTKVVAFGGWLPVKWMVGPQEETARDMKVRALLVGGVPKEFTTGNPHEVTDKVFVVRRAYRLNDSLPEDGRVPRWKWVPGGWLMVDRGGARITRLSLPEFDSYYSQASWFRDYAAYCGVADSGKLYAMVVQIGRKKPVLKKLIGTARFGELPEAECAPPTWQRRPARVVFAPASGEKISFDVRGQSVELPADTQEESEAEQ